MKKTIFLLLLVTLLLACAFTLLACNKDSPYTVSFIVDGEVYSVYVTEGNERISIPENPDKSGYRFVGWYLYTENAESPFTEEFLLDKPLEADMCVYARWERMPDDSEQEPGGGGQGGDEENGNNNQGGDEENGDMNETLYTVSFEANGGSAVPSITGSSVDISPLTEREGCTFLGWYSDISLGEGYEVSFPFGINCDVTLYAKWSVDYTPGLIFEWNESDGTYTVIGYNGTDREVVVPGQYLGAAVSAIAQRAFENNPTVARVVICEGITSLGARAFYGCTALKSLVIPESVLTIGGDVLGGCAALESLSVPFFGDSRKGADDAYRYPLGYFFGTKFYTGGMETMQLYYAKSTTDYTYGTYYIPETLRSVTVTDGDLHFGAFSGCMLLTDITLEEGVTFIGESALLGCTALERLYISATVEQMNEYAFEGVQSILEIRVHEDNPSYCSIDGNLYSKDGTQLLLYTVGKADTTFTMPDTVTVIGTYAFSSSRLSRILFSKNLTAIGYGAFAYCTNLDEVILPESVTTIGDYAFTDCLSLTRIVLQENIQKIGKYAFRRCTSLAYIQYSGSKTEWGRIQCGTSWNANTGVYQLVCNYTGV